MEPLLNQENEGSGNKCNKQTQYPKGVDSRRKYRCLERWNAGNWDGRVDEVATDGEVGCLIDELDEENIGEIFGLLLQVLVRLDDECGDDRRE